MYTIKHTMNDPIKRAVLILCAALLLTSLPACNVPSGGESSISQVESAPAAGSSAAPESAAPESTDAPASVPAAQTMEGATSITLSGGEISIDGPGAEAQDGVVTITAGGAYAVSGTLQDGRLIVNAPGADVTLALNGADITCSYGSPIYIYKAGTATLQLAEGTENVLADGKDYTYADQYSSQEEEEPNACLYSKADMIITGGGSLKVNANCDNGITGKDTLLISGSTISVTAVDNGINGKDSNTIEDAHITVSCGGDAIRSTNDADQSLGWVRISDSALELTSGEDGVQAETSLSISGGSCHIISGGGSGARIGDEDDGKGIKAGTALTLEGGSYSLDCADDAVHSNGDVTVTAGDFQVSSGDDAFHADETLAVSGVEIDILTSYEGLEGTAVEVSGGRIRLVSSDDGVNAAGGMDGSGFGRGGAFGGANSDSHIDISGGYLVVNAGGDGLDSNGSASISGGTVIVSSTGQGDGALDYDGSFNVTGGTLLAAGSGGMAQAPSQAGQYTVVLGFDSTLPAGTYISLAGAEDEHVFQMTGAANHLVVSMPELKGGAEYTVSYGGTYSGQSEDGICSGGSYSGGTVLAELTLSDYITIYGNAGMGRVGGRPGGDVGGTPKENWGGFSGERQERQGRDQEII